jgi:16S rRNA (uracil1498-N3)-methyltransferase
MRVYRFYVSPDMELRHDFWLHNEQLIKQWNRVLRFKPGQELVLFDGVEHERLYRLVELSGREAHLELITDYVRKLPKREVYLFWSLLKRDNNDWVLQKGTELGVSHFIPLLSERTEKTGFKLDRAQKIILEAVEQCGRSDIPAVREPMKLETALKDYKGKIDLYVCEQTTQLPTTDYQLSDTIGVLVGPEGGWSDQEKELFKKEHLRHLSLHDFTLRAETACIAAVTKLLQ